MDPQQRLLLEVAWEALEDAGLPRDASGRQRAPACSSACMRAATIAAGQFADPTGTRRLHEHRHRAQHRRRPALLPARTAGAERRGRHRLLVVARRGAPGLPEPARRRVRPGAGRRREPDPARRR